MWGVGGEKRPFPTHYATNIKYLKPSSLAPSFQVPECAEGDWLTHPQIVNKLGARGQVQVMLGGTRLWGCSVLSFGPLCGKKLQRHIGRYNKVWEIHNFADLQVSRCAAQNIRLAAR